MTDINEPKERSNMTTPTTDSHWTVHDNGSTAEGTPVPVTSAGTFLGTLTPIWSDVDGVRVEFAAGGPIDDLSADDARALADALRYVADTRPPTT